MEINLLEFGLTIAASIFGGGALLAFVQFMITRHDEKKEKRSTVASEISRIEEKVDELYAIYLEDKATEARIRIIQFADEERHKLKHSQESFDQIHQDIDKYTKYCAEHADYENSKAVAAIKYVKELYQHYLLEDEGFLD